MGIFVGYLALDRTLMGYPAFILVRHTAKALFEEVAQDHGEQQACRQYGESDLEVPG